MIWVNENKYDSIINGMALGYEVPAPLIKGVMAKESAFNEKAYKSEPKIHDASRGLMQLLYHTATALGYRGTADDLYAPSTNIQYGAKLLAENIKRAGGRYDVAVSAYNAGWSKVRKNDAPRKPDMTFVNQEYVNDVNVYAAYFAGKIPEEEAKTYLRSKAWAGGSPLFF